MIKANELRIGNYVLTCHGVDLKIYGIISKGNTGGYLLETLKPIPITEEWLLGFGFEYINIDNDYHIYASLDHNYYLQIDVRKNTDEYTILDNSVDDLRDFALVKIKYIHQLQNIYFALTGEELTLSVT